MRKEPEKRKKRESSEKVSEQKAAAVLTRFFATFFTIFDPSLPHYLGAWKRLNVKTLLRQDDLKL